MPRNGAITLQDYPRDHVFTVSCAKCGRAGKYRWETLAQRYGLAMGLPDMLAQISADCPKRQQEVWSDRCGVIYGAPP
jgi:hypothetical protein